MALVRLQWGGVVRDGVLNNDPVVEEWTNSLALLAQDDPNLGLIIEGVAYYVAQWFQSAAAAISPTVHLDFLKCNEVDIVTGHQITDPTLEASFPPETNGGGAGVGYPALSTSYKISIDDGTRSRRAKGGWFVPRTTMAIGSNGRFDEVAVGQAVASAKTMLDALNAMAGYSVGVWSRADHAVIASSRIRIGDVPDNVSRRRNDLRESYQVDGIA